jgi:hypothetical protein
MFRTYVFKFFNQKIQKALDGWIQTFTFLYLNLGLFPVLLSFKKQRVRNTAANLTVQFLCWANVCLFLSTGKTLQQLADANQREAEARQARNIYNL